MAGLVDGIRLHNDLHMKPTAPRLVLFVAQKGDSLFHPVLLQVVAHLASSGKTVIFRTSVQVGF